MSSDDIEKRKRWDTELKELQIIESKIKFSLFFPFTWL